MYIILTGYEDFGYTESKSSKLGFTEGGRSAPPPVLKKSPDPPGTDRVNIPSIQLPPFPCQLVYSSLHPACP